MTVPTLLTNQEELSSWLQQPMTQEFMQFLADRRVNLMEAWASGQTMNPQWQAQAMTLTMLINLKAEDVRAFYDIPSEQDDEHLGD